MANESRRRAEQSITSKAPQVDAKTTASLYKKLAVGPKSIRLLKIKQHTRFDDPIVCQIKTACFADKPRFVALSYKWSTDEPKQSILLNDVATEVGQNLSDALQYLRRRDSEETLYWIDALCINQQDTAERNEQVGIMRYIYFRASTVLVWLGKKYERYDAIFPKMADIADAIAGPDENPKATSQTSIHCNTLQQGAKEGELSSMTLAKELYNDEYWSRVWIVQEIGLAEELEVCLGHSSTSWPHFIAFMTFHNLGNEGPLKLDKQRKTKHNGGCMLLELVDNFKYAKCKDRKDKIYGLLGLAMDARRFPIDYDKSLFDIWRDVMEFAKKHHMLEDQDIISIGRLVKFTLMGDEEQPLETILRPYSPVEEATTIIDKPKSKKVFKIPGIIIGCVQYVGPQIDDIVGDPSNQETWEYNVQANYRYDAIPAHHESEGFLRSIVDPDGPDLSRACFSYTSVVQWTTKDPSSLYGNIRSSMIQKVRDLQSQEDLQSQDHTRKGSSDVAAKSETQSKSILLYQLYGFNDGDNWRFGIASDQARRGDLICWVKSTSRALIIRLVKNDPLTFQAIGTAVVAEDIRGFSRQRHANRWKDLQQGFENIDMETFIDSTLIFILLGCGSPDGIS